MNYQYISSKIEKIKGFLIPGQEEILFKFASNCPDNSNLLEIGSFEGRSTMCLLYGIKNSRKHLYSIDRWDWPDNNIMSRVISLTIEAGLKQYHTTIMANTKEYDFSTFNNIQFCFIDGDHTYDGVKNDFYKWFEIAPVGSTVLMHDYVTTFPDVVKFCEEIRPLLNDTEIIHSMFKGVKK